MNESSQDKDERAITFEDFDALRLGGFGKRLTSFIHIDRHFVDGALTVALNGKFGSGKSTFFEMWRNQIASEETPKFDTVFLNAWDADFLRDPLLSIVSSFIKHFEEDQPNLAQQIKGLAGWLARFSTSAVNDVTKAILKVDVQKAVEAGENNPEKRGRECFEDFEGRKRAFDDLRNLLGEIATHAERPIVVIVDELDRCRPDYAVEYLEVMKHIFDIQNLVFILGIDRDSMASSVSALFGHSLNFEEYFRKFAHRSVTLPHPDDAVLIQFARDLWGKYTKNETISRQIDTPICHGLNGLDQKILRLLSLSPRQLHEAIRVSVHALHIRNPGRGQTSSQIAENTYTMALLSVSKAELYHRLGSADCSVEDTLDFLALFKGDEDFWANPSTSYYLVSLINWILPPSEQNYADISEGLLQRRLIPADGPDSCKSEDIFENLKGRRMQGFPDLSSGYQTSFRRIYLILEEVGDFAR